jgi:hypothetical protein
VLDATVTEAQVVMDLPLLPIDRAPLEVHDVAVGADRADDRTADRVGVAGLQPVADLLEDHTGLLTIVSSGCASQDAVRDAAPLDVIGHERDERAWIAAHQRVVGGLDLAEHEDHLPRCGTQPVKPDQRANAARRYIIVPDVDGWHTRLSCLGLQTSPLEDMPWGMGEFRLTDPSGNNVRIGTNIDQS